MITMITIMMVMVMVATVAVVRTNNTKLINSAKAFLNREEKKVLLELLAN